MDVMKDRRTPVAELTEDGDHDSDCASTSTDDTASRQAARQTRAGGVPGSTERTPLPGGQKPGGLAHLMGEPDRAGLAHLMGEPDRAGLAHLMGEPSPVGAVPLMVVSKPTDIPHRGRRHSTLEKRGVA
ncbi:MAG TPA: hypothetical protein VME46_18700 [Acidimicrobiales bacterium]|nr:hypothetical protein [Acidimicrobiales bacterium]